MEGERTGVIAILKEKFSWKELRSSLIQFATALLLLWLRLKGDPWQAALYSFLIVLVFALAEAIFALRAESGKIKWKLRYI